MKKSLFFSSMLATLATAGSALMMSAAPVMAAEGVQTGTSHLQLGVEGGAELNLMQVPGYDFGTIGATSLRDTFWVGAEANIDGQKVLHVLDTRGSSGYTNWNLSAKIDQNFKSTTTNLVLGKTEIALSNSTENASPSDNITISPGAKLESQVDHTIATGGDISGADINFKASHPYGYLQQSGTPNARANDGEKFQGIVVWTLDGGIQTPQSL